MKPDEIRKKIGLVFVLGQNYFDEANSDSYAQNRRSDTTRLKYEEVADAIVSAALAAIETARRTGAYWKDELVAANKEIEQLRAAIETARREERAKIVRELRAHAARIVDYYEGEGFTHEHVLNILIQTIAVSAPMPSEPPTGDENE